MLWYRLYILPYILLALGSFVAAFGLSAVVQSNVVALGGDPVISEQAIVNEEGLPDENEPDCENYKVSNNQPRKIIMPTINTEGCLQKVSIDSKGAIGVPNNIHVGGWYIGLSMPGNKGLSLIDGHLRGLYNQGIFENLYKLKGGDKFEIEYGDGSSKKFEVVSVKQYTVRETSARMFYKHPDIDSQLNLITCFGEWQSDTRQFNQRILVVTKLVR